MELLKNLEGLSADEQMTAVVELQKAAMKTLEEQKQASIGKSAELVIQGLKKIKSDFEAKFDSLNYDIQTKVDSLKDGEQGLQGPKGDQGERGLDGANGRDGRDGKDGKDGLDGVDGVGVRDAKIDFDGSLVISLTDGREINCGEVVSVDVAKQIQKVTHNIQTGSGGDSQTVLDAIAAIQATIATYGTMATQNANNVAITGGAINNTTIGATTPSTGVFTTLTATGQANIGTGLARYLVASGSASGSPGMYATGGSMTFSGGGGAGVNFYSNLFNQLQFNIAHTASAVNYVQVTGAATGSRPAISAQGSDSAVGLTYVAKGTGSSSRHAFQTGSGTQFLIVDSAAGAVNSFQVSGGASGVSPTLASQGSDTNIDLNLTTKGTGNVNIGTGNGTQFMVGDTFAGGTATNFYKAQGTAGGGVVLVADGASTNVQAYLASKGASPISFTTAGVGVEQMRVSHTASAVNYVQVTGAATGGGTQISSQGSDTNIGLQLRSKGTGAINLMTAGGTNQVVVSNTASSVNYLTLTGSATGSAAKVGVDGSDTNIPLVLQPKGTGALQAQQTDSTATGGNARGANAVDWQTIRSGASQVAAGQYGVVSGGISNTVNSVGGVIGGGSGNFVSSSGYVGGIFSGLSNQSNGFYSPVVGGASNQANGYYNFVGGGFTNTGTANAAVTTQSATMNGTTAVTLAASNASIKVGQYISGTSIANDTYVAAVSGTSLTLSKVASGSSTSTLSFYTPHGVVVGGGNNQATGSYSFIGGGGDAGTAANRNVASGDWSVVAGGQKNTASGRSSVVVGGFSNTASTDGAAVVGGGFYAGNAFPNNASGTCSFIGGGFSNQASGFGTVVVGGNSNIGNGTYSMAGGLQGTNRLLHGGVNFSSGALTVIGDNQYGIYLAKKQTTDATATVLTFDNSAAGTNNQVILPNNSAYYFRGEVVSGVTGGGNTKGWFIEGVIKRGANAASTALVGTPTVTSNYADAGASTWTIAVTADTTNGGLAVTFTGQAATTIRTVAQIRTTEMTY